MTIGLFITFYSFVSDANLNNYYQILFAFVGTLVSVLIGFLLQQLADIWQDFCRIFF